MPSVRKQFRPAQLDLASRWLDLEDRAEILEESGQSDMAVAAREAASLLWEELKVSVNNLPLLNRLTREMTDERERVRDKSELMKEVSSGERLRDLMFRPLEKVWKCPHQWCGYYALDDPMSKEVIQSDPLNLLFECPNRHRWIRMEAQEKGQKILHQCPQCHKLGVWIGNACKHCHRAVPLLYESGDVVVCKECGVIVEFAAWDDHWSHTHSATYAHIERSQRTW